MVILTGDQILSLILGLIFIFPTVLLYRNYRITQITDFLLFSGVFFASAIASLANVLSIGYDLLIFYQLNVGMINLTFFLLFLHGLKLRFKEPPRLFTIIGFGYFAIITVFLLLWRIEIQPDEAFVIFTTMPASLSNTHPNGASFSINGILIYSTSFYIIGLLYWIFSISFLIWAYATVEVINPTENIIRAKRLWLATWVIDLIWAVFLLPYIPQIEELNVLLLIANILIVYITLKYPESTLISNDQIVRSLGLYDKIMKMDKEDDVEEFGMVSLVDYLKSLPEDLLPTR